MRKFRRHAASVAIAMATCAGLASLSRAADPTADADQLRKQQAQIDALQAQIDALKASQQPMASAPAAQPPVAATADGTTSSVIADADRRSSDPLHLQDTDGQFLGGWKNGRFELQSADGNYLFHPWLALQYRYVADYRQSEKASGSDDWEQGFELGRLWVGADGNVINKDLTYAVIMSFGRTTGAPTLVDTWMRYRFADHWAVRVGQFRDPFAHEGLISLKKLMSSDRSFVENQLGGNDNYVKGVTLIYDDQHSFRAEGGLTSGFAKSNENFQTYTSNPTTGNYDFGLAGRGEYKFMGDWLNYDNQTALGVKRDLLVGGAAFDWSEQGDTNVFHHTLDLQYDNVYGWGLYAAYYGNYTGDNEAVVTTGTGRDTYDWGVELQASYLFTTKWEGFARYDYTRLDTGTVAAASEHDVHEITGGANYYFHGHDAKVTLEFDYLPNGSPVNDAVREDVLLNDGNAELLFKGQVQLLI